MNVGGQEGRELEKIVNYGEEIFNYSTDLACGKKLGKSDLLCQRFHLPNRIEWPYQSR